MYEETYGLLERTSVRANSLRPNSIKSGLIWLALALICPILCASKIRAKKRGVAQQITSKILITYE